MIAPLQGDRKTNRSSFRAQRAQILLLIWPSQEARLAVDESRGWMGRGVGQGSSLAADHPGAGTGERLLPVLRPVHACSTPNRSSYIPNNFTRSDLATATALYR